VADFLTIYIEEAHASYEWLFSKNYHQFSQHVTIDDRIKAAKTLLERNPPFPVVSDVISDEANGGYGGLYERLYVIKDGRVELVGGKGPDGYDMDVVRDWLVKYSDKVKGGQKNRGVGDGVAVAYVEQPCKK